MSKNRQIILEKRDDYDLFSYIIDHYSQFNNNLIICYSPLTKQSYKSLLKHSYPDLPFTVISLADTFNKLGYENIIVVNCLNHETLYSHNSLLNFIIELQHDNLIFIDYNQGEYDGEF